MLRGWEWILIVIVECGSEPVNFGETVQRGGKEAGAPLCW